MTLHAYRAGDELAAALREHQAADDAFVEQIVAYDREHPGRELLWARSPFSVDRHAMGFADGTDDVPSGLSRAKGRTALIPRKGKTGDPWRETLEWAQTRPRVERVYQRFGIPAAGRGGDTGSGGFYVAPAVFIDGGGRDAFVACKYSLELDERTDEHRDLAPHLEAIPLSEFYAVKERLDAARAATRDDAQAVTA